MIREDFLKLMYQRSTGTGYVVNCDTYELRFVNPPLLRVINQDFDTWQNKICYQFIYGYSAPCDFCRMHKTKEGTPARWYHNSPFSDRALLMRDFKLNFNEEELFLQTAYNIPKEMEELQLLTANMTAEQLLTECAKTLTLGENSVDILLDQITNFYGGTCGFLFYKNETEQEFSLKNEYYPAGKHRVSQQVQMKSFVLEDTKEWLEDFNQLHFLYVSKDSSSDTLFKKMDKLYPLLQDSLLLTKLSMDGKLVGILGIQNPSENKEHLCLIPTISGFLRNHFTIQNTIHDLMYQKNACETVLNCVETLVAKDDLKEGIAQLLEHITQYFQSSRTVLLKNNKGNLELYSEFHQNTLVSTENKMNQFNYEQLNDLFEHFATDNTLLISSVAEELNGIQNVEQWLSQGLQRILGIRIYEENQVSYFLLVINPHRNYVHFTVLEAISQFVESHLTKDKLLKRLSELSYTDTLTGLYNRNFFHEYTKQLEENHMKNIAVIYADVNGLKKANDNFGHELGDVLLKWAGKFLQKNSDGMVFRLGGDEYLCLLEGIKEKDFKDTQAHLEKKLSEYSECHMSVGFAWDENAEKIEALMKEADTLMYADKQKFYKIKAQDTRSVCDSLQDFKEELLFLQKELEQFDER